MNIGYGPGINSYTDRNEGSPQLVLSVGLVAMASPTAEVEIMCSTLFCSLQAIKKNST
jgi:hypothetical protein